jgi:hypothetical protein
MAWISRLRVDGIGPADLPGVLDSPCLDGFHGFLELVLRGQPEGLAGVFAARPRLRSLTGLGFANCTLKGQFAALCREGPWGEVGGLEVSAARIGTRDLQALADSRLGANLRLLVARGNTIGGAGVAAVCRSSPGLSAVYLDSNRLDRKAGEALATLPGLRWLSVTRNKKLAAAGIEAIANGAGAGTLYYMNLAFLDGGDDMCRALAEGRLANLVRMDVSGDAAMTADGVRMLVESPNLTSLTWLGVPMRHKRAGGLPRREGLQVQ